MNKSVVIVQTGVANTASVVAALKRLEREVLVTQEKAELEQAQLLILPGVGSFGEAMATLRQHGLVETLRERVINGNPTLSFCVGLQILAKSSEESPGEEGLAVFPEAIKRFPDTVAVPQFGWNEIKASENSSLIQDGYAYFANSYRLTECPQGWQPSFSEHGGKFIAALEREHVLACQFHPELSGPWGQQLIARWLSSSEATLC